MCYSSILSILLSFWLCVGLTALIYILLISQAVFILFIGLCCYVNALQAIGFKRLIILPLGKRSFANTIKNKHILASAASVGGNTLIPAICVGPTALIIVCYFISQAVFHCVQVACATTLMPFRQYVQALSGNILPLSSQRTQR